MLLRATSTQRHETSSWCPSQTVDRLFRLGAFNSLCFEQLFCWLTTYSAAVFLYCDFVVTRNHYHQVKKSNEGAEYDVISGPHTISHVWVLKIFQSRMSWNHIEQLLLNLTASASCWLHINTSGCHAHLYYSELVIDVTFTDFDNRTITNSSINNLTQFVSLVDICVSTHKSHQSLSKLQAFSVLEPDVSPDDGSRKKGSWILCISLTCLGSYSSDNKH